ncbi:hypothetical protein MRX96_019842 [Rhipicephalus microplus]
MAAPVLIVPRNGEQGIEESVYASRAKVAAEYGLKGPATDMKKHPSPSHPNTAPENGVPPGRDFEGEASDKRRKEALGFCRSTGRRAVSVARRRLPGERPANFGARETMNETAAVHALYHSRMNVARGKEKKLRGGFGGRRPGILT